MLFAYERTNYSQLFHFYEQMVKFFMSNKRRKNISLRKISKESAGKKNKNVRKKRVAQASTDIS